MRASRDIVRLDAMDGFIGVKLNHTTLDIYFVRRAIERFLRSHMAELNGTLLDIGAGYAPYRELLTTPPSRVDTYTTLDLPGNPYQPPDVLWNGVTMPFEDASVDCALATELFEHCPDPELVMREAHRVLKPSGFMLLTVPFLWPLHCVPGDEYRFTPFALERHLRGAGFAGVELSPLGGWNASLAQMLGLWAARKPMTRVARSALTRAAIPAIRGLLARDQPPREFGESTMITGISGKATKAS